ncbi:MAG: fasciclin domain-containing protein [Deltaproteobacteria bacterium]|nr:fasciclin domain-containing protein [Deltaproteobacteria bacterium]
MNPRHPLTALALMSLVTAAACGDDDDNSNKPIATTTTKNIVEVAEAQGFSSLLSAAQQAGLADVLAGPGPFTVFAPTNAAFQALGSAAPSDPDLLANVLLSHVVSGKLDSSAVTSGQPLTSLAKTQLEVKVSGSKVTVNGFALSATLDVPASNGVIHVLDQVIVPPTIVEAASASSDLSTLVAAVGVSSSAVQSALTAGGPITVFAPVNSAFAAIPSADLDALLADQSALDEVLTYHVVAGQVLSSDLSDGQVVSTVGGKTLRVGLDASGATLTDESGNVVRVSGPDVRLLNGVVHLIDGVLTPAAPVTALGNIVEVAQSTGGFSTLLGAATSAGLAASLAGPNELTVFAPTDTAFAALGVDLSLVEDDVLANILLHHVVPGALRSSEVVSRTSLATLANTSLSVDTSGGSVRIGGAALTATLDVEASNGLIHVASEVIVPPTIVEVAAATGALSTLVTAVGAASQTVQDALAPNTLAGDMPITVFAPTNDAFSASGIDLGALDQSTLDAVLAHHVLPMQGLSTALNDGDTLTTLNGDLTVVVDSDGTIGLVDGQGNRANVVSTLKDIRTLTGVVHVIDSVLRP